MADTDEKIIQRYDVPDPETTTDDEGYLTAVNDTRALASKSTILDALTRSKLDPE